MSEPFVMITTHRIKPGREQEFEAVAHEYERFVEANEPRAHGHLGYADGASNEFALVQIHPDAESAEFHMQVAHPAIGRALELVDTLAVDVYGQPGPILQQALDANAAAGAVVKVRPARLGGFLRCA